MAKSALHLARMSYQPKMPASLQGAVKIIEGKATEAVSDKEEIAAIFPRIYGLPLISFAPGGERTEYPPTNVGVILSGGQAPGGHNVIAGLFDEMKLLNPDSRLFGFLMGPDGLIEHKYRELTAEVIDEYRNTGGFDMIGSGRTKLDKPEQFEAGIQVIGCPKTIDGDLKNKQIETSFGFDTAAKVYSELIGNIQRDCNSARKYWHFIKLMGRSASHITLECALQTHPNICIVSEEVEANNYYLDDVVTYIAETVVRRSEAGMNFGTVLIPEGLIEFLPAMKRLIKELNEFLSQNDAEFKLIKRSAQRQYIKNKLSPENSRLYDSLPVDVARQLIADRDPHGNVQVSLIATEKLLADMTAQKLAEWTEEGRFQGRFSTLTHFFGYEGRCAMPSNFDANYCYCLGRAASILIAAGKTGYMAAIKNTADPVSEWEAGGVPMTMMMNMERRSGKMKPVIRKALVDMDGEPYRALREMRREWALSTEYVYPGPIQFFGPEHVCDSPTMTLRLEKNDR